MTLPPRLNETDVKLLRVFLAVVTHGGFTPAQIHLNVSAATISGQMAALEQRLGFRLCERGRAGFRLTEEGRAIHAAGQKIFEAHETFRGEVAALKGETASILRFGIVDNTVTNSHGRVVEALTLFSEAAPDVHVAITVDGPVALEQALLDRRLEVAVAAFHHHAPGIEYSPVFEEEQGLYCGRGAELYSRAHKVETPEIVKQRFVTRGYLGERQTAHLVPAIPGATVYNMEAVMLLLLTGHYIGYLPRHSAKVWEESGELRELRPDLFSYSSTFELAYRRGQTQASATRTFIRCLVEAHGLRGDPSSVVTSRQRDAS
jgi:LysR family transcriptional regulator, transcriptional activator for bauABCD operon